MHTSAMKYGALFFDNYCKNRENIVIVDIGAQDVNGSLRDVAPDGVKYIGVDFVDGRNVDVILEDPYKLPFEDGSLDIVVCSSVFEHSQFFWILFLEIMRVLKPSGLLYLNVPSNGYIHRYPVDCWRFYPDAALSLVAWANREGYTSMLLESFVANKNKLAGDEGQWNDFVAIFLKNSEYSAEYERRILHGIDEYSNAYCDMPSMPFNENFYPEDILDIKSLHSSNEKLKVENTELKADLEYQSHHIESLLNSKSWKLTAPLRWLSNCIYSCWGSIKNSNFKKDEVREDLHMSYQAWIDRYDSPSAEFLSQIKKKIFTGNRTSLISIGMVLVDPSIKKMIPAIESVIGQTYPFWELYIVYDSSLNSSFIDALQEYQSKDGRIILVPQEEKLNIVQGLNRLLKLMPGTWLTILDADNLLSKEALLWTAEVIFKHQDISCIYGDEDRITLGGVRYGPYFKPGWNKDLFYSSNYLGSPIFYKNTALKGLNILIDNRFESAPLFELTLQFLKHLSDNHIYHIPKILCHSLGGNEINTNRNAREIESRAFSLNEYFLDAGIKAKAIVESCGLRIQYEIPTPKPLVSLIIPTRNGAGLLKKCINSILEKTLYPNYEILVINNNSDELEALEYFKTLELNSKVRVINDFRDFNYSALNNSAVNFAHGEVLGLLNNDVEVIAPEWLEEMVSYAIQPEIGAVGAKLLYPNNTIQHAGIILGIAGWAGHASKFSPFDSVGYHNSLNFTSSVSAVTGACLLVRKDVFLSVGGLNEKDLAIACNDVDFCLKLNEAGLRNIYTPYAVLYHHESATRGHEDTIDKQNRFKKELQFMKGRWGNKLVADPFYNPNLTKDHEDYSFFVGDSPWEKEYIHLTALNKFTQ